MGILTGAAGGQVRGRVASWGNMRHYDREGCVRSPSSWGESRRGKSYPVYLPISGYVLICVENTYEGQ